MLDLGQISNFLIKLVKTGELGVNTIKNFFFQASVRFFLLLSKILIVFSSFEFLNDEILKLNTSVKESLERVLKSLNPEELLIVVLSDEFISCVFNLIKVVRDNLSSSEKLELILNFNQIITSVGINTGD